MAPNLAVDFPSIPALLQTRAHDTQLAQRVKRLGLWQRITWQEHVQQVNGLARALIGLGLAPQDHVAILCENRPEWLVSDLAVQSAGGVSVGIYTTSSAQQVAYILEHSEAVGLIVDNAEQIEKYLEIKDTLPKLAWVVALEPDSVRDLIVWDDLMAKGKAFYNEDPEPVHARISALQPDDTALLMYTSGTTGPPKGVMLSHRNLLWAVDSLMGVTHYNSADSCISYLPLSHIVERGGSYAHIKSGFVLHFVENLDTFAQNLAEIRPTVLFAVPRIWEKLHATLELHMRDAHTFKRLTYQWALRTVNGRDPAQSQRQLAALMAELLVIRWLKERLGLDRLRLAISGAAPISPQILGFFRSLGIDLREGYGMTENTGLATIHQTNFTSGTVGTPFPGVEVRIADDGEILTRSQGMFQGYFKNPDATAAVLTITPEGPWLHTGDIGSMDAQGQLLITDRKKDIIITAGGKNIAPQKIENLLKASIFVTDAIVIGDKRKYLSALLVLDEDNISQWANDQQLSYTTYSDLATHPEVRKLVTQDVNAINKQLSRVETIKRFTILPKRLHHEDGEVTATLKVKRTSIARKYADLIEAMYSSATPDLVVPEDQEGTA